jgi:hypothetical protein
MNPYNMAQVDAQGLLGIYQGARQNRLREMQMQREEQRAEAEFEKKTKVNSLLANIAKSMQPKGGGQSSLSAPPDTSANPQPGAAPAQPSMEDMMGQLAGLDFDTWSKIDSRQKEQAKQATQYLGNAVMDVSRLPEQDRPAAWARYVQQAEARGMDIPAHLERYSPDALNQAAAEAGTMEKLIKRFEPEWRFSPNGGLVDFNNPQSIEQYGQWMSGQGPGQTPAPPPGFVIDGGPTPAASGSFRP